MSVQTNVVVIGGGYAGVMAANHLRLDAVVDYCDVLGADVRLLVDTAERIDARSHTVELGSGGTIGYDYLIYALGSTGAALTIPGAEFVHPLSELEHAEVLRATLTETLPDAAICVVGAGPTGIETAGELAEQGHAVTLVCGGALGPYLSEPGRKSVRRRLRRLGVTVIDGPGGRVVEVQMHSVLLADGRKLPSTVTIWTAGFGVPDLAVRSGLATDAIGRLLTDETLTSIDDPYVIAAGDAAAPSNSPLRLSCQAALPLGAQAANTVLSRIANTEPAAVDQAFTGQCISVGRKAATIQFAHRDDQVLPLYLGGRAAAVVKEAVCTATISFLAREARRPGSYFWLKGGKRVARLAGSTVPAND